MIQSVSHQDHRTADARPTVCHVIHALSLGGAEVLVDQMVRRMNDEFRGVVAVLDEIGELGHRLRQDGITVRHLERRPGIDWKCAVRLRQFADQEGACLIHAHQCTPFFHATLSRGVFGKRPVVLTEHGRHCPDLPSRRRILANRLLLKPADRLIACSASVRQALIDNEGLPAERIEIIRNGVDLEQFRQPAADARMRIRTALGIRATDPVALMVARLHELKDHGTALRTAERVRRQRPDFKLLLAGEGDQRGTIERTIHELQLHDTVHLLGSRSDIPELLATADLFLLTSVSEGIPLTVIEAMAAGRPVVATAVGGVPEVVIPGRCGFLASAGDCGSLAAAILELLADPSLRSRFADSGLCRVREQFSLTGMLDRYRQIYREILNAGRAHHPGESHRRALNGVPRSRDAETAGGPT